MSRKAEAPAAPVVMTVAERQRKFREQRVADGWLCVSTIWLEPEAAAKLQASIDKHGGTATDAINRLLKRSRP